jgi:signal transduction histidine kinase
METVDDAWALACERKVEIALWPMPETACTAGDRSLLSRAITNVLHNAVKYSPDGGVVRCGVQARGTHWVVCVRDEGPGISASQQDLLFAPFTRLHDQSHPQVTGVGLGLALVQTVVQRHGGSIEVDSTPGHGAEFRLVFTACDEAGLPNA